MISLVARQAAIFEGGRTFEALIFRPWHPRRSRKTHPKNVVHITHFEAFIVPITRPNAPLLTIGDDAPAEQLVELGQMRINATIISPADHPEAPQGLYGTARRQPRITLLSSTHPGFSR